MAQKSQEFWAPSSWSNPRLYHTLSPQWFYSEICLSLPSPALVPTYPYSRRSSFSMRGCEAPLPLACKSHWGSEQVWSPLWDWLAAASGKRLNGPVVGLGCTRFPETVLSPWEDTVSRIHSKMAREQKHVCTRMLIATLQSRNDPSVHQLMNG